MDLKIAVIGAGSLSFTPSLLRDFAQFKDLFGSKIVLMDIDDSKLPQVLDIAKRINKVAGANYIFKTTTDRKKALENADFVIISIETARMGLWRTDFSISEKYGVYQPQEENGGPGGFAHSMRQIPAIMDICHDMEKMCPDAWIINLSNPMTQICSAIHRYTNLKFVGLCHGIQEIRKPLAKVLGVDEERLDLKAAGINHFTWILNMTLKPNGEDMYPLLREKLSNYGPTFMESPWSTNPTKFMPLSRDLFDLYGLFPSPSDGHITEFIHLCPKEKWPQYNMKNFDIDAYTSYLDREIREIIEISKDEEKIKKYLAKRSPIIAVDIISAIVHDHNTLCLAVNITNEGCISNLPEDSVVEIPAIASAQGIRGISMGKLPSSIVSFCQRALTINEFIVDAIIEGSYNLALQALVLGPYVKSIDTAKKLLDEFLSVYKDYVPRLK